MKEQNIETVKIDGMGKDAKVVENQYGGKQSDAPTALHLIEPKFALSFIKKTVENSFAHKAIYKIYQYLETGNKILLDEAITEIEADTCKLFFIIGKVLKEGAKKYPINNWKKIPLEEHLNHALNHLFAFSVGDIQDDHVEHALCRLMMAISTETSKEFSNAKLNTLEGLWHGFNDNRTSSSIL